MTHTNLWEELLGQVGPGEKLQSGTAVILGSPGVGKRSLVSKLLKAEVLDSVARKQQREPTPQQLDQAVTEVLRERTPTVAGVGYTYLDPSAIQGASWLRSS